MHDAFRNAFMIEVRDLLPQDEIFQQRRAAISGLERVLIVVDPHTLIGRQKLPALSSVFFSRLSSFGSSGAVPCVSR